VTLTINSPDKQFYDLCTNNKYFVTFGRILAKTYRVKIIYEK